MGQYIANVGPQHTFVIPNGVLNPHGANTLIIAVTSTGGAGNGLAKIALTNLGTVRGGVPVALDRSPAWNAQTWGSASSPNVVAMEGLSGNAPARRAYQLSVAGVVKGTAYLSDLPWVSAVIGWHSVLRDENVTGGPLSIDGVPYAKGLGTNSISTIVYDVPAGCTTFSSDVGVDDAAGGHGSVTFTVRVDGKTVASTGVMRGGQPAQQLSAPVTGGSTLTLDVGDAGHDNSDWAHAALHCAG